MNIKKNAMPIKLKKYQLSPLRIAAVYALIGGLWILFSDTLLAALVADKAVITRISIYKGWSFVMVTAGLLYWLVRRYAEKQGSALNRIERLNRLYRVISKSSEAILRMKDRHSLFSEASRLAVEEGGLRMAWIGLVDEKDKFVRPAASYGVVDGYLDLISISIDPDLPEGRGPTGAAIREGRNFICNDIKNDPRMQRWREQALKRGYRSSAAIPLKSEGRILGSLNLYASRPSFFDAEEVMLIETLAANLSLAIESIRNEEERRKALEALQEREERLISVIEQSPIGIVFSRDGITLDANKAYLRMFGYADLEELRGTSLIDQIAPQYRPEMLEGIRQRAQGQAVETAYETMGLRKDGSQFPFFVSGSRVVLSDGPVTISFFIDITARKKAEEELRITNEELLSINRIIITTTAAVGVKEILERVLEEALRITGLEGGTICLVTPDEALQIAAHRATSEATIQDLTTHTVKIGECLCGECARNHRPLILWDRDAVLNYSTREAQRGEDIRFHAAYPLVIGEKCLGVLCVFTRTDKKPRERSLKFLETATSQIAIAVQNAQLFDEVKAQAETLEKRINERTLALQDSRRALTNIVEDLNRKTTALEAANNKLKELDKLKSLFIASMSHELRTPLNSVIGFSSVLLNQWAGPVSDEQKNLLSTISRSGKHLLFLINDVIDVSKIEAGVLDVHLEDFDLYDVIAEVVDVMKKEVSEKKLELNVDSIHLEMHTDRRRLFQSVLNLVNNAVKFTLKGSVSVHVHARKVPSSMDQGSRIEGQAPRVKGQSEADISLLLATWTLPLDTDFVEISVEDTGIGIREEDIPKLFKSFVRLDSPLRTTVLGTGLGLYLTKKLVTEMLKGDIVVESRYESGSKFAIRVPVKLMNNNAIIKQGTS